MARASRSKRSEKASLDSFMATIRSRRVSRALYTSPMPPAPIGFRISYGPRRDPEARGIDLEFYFKSETEQIGRPIRRVTCRRDPKPAISVDIQFVGQVGPRR